AAVGVSASDTVSAGTSLGASTQFKKDAGSFGAGLPSGLSLVIASTGANSRSWTLSGNPQVAQGVYVIRVTVTSTLCSKVVDATITVSQENAAIEYTGDTIAQINTALSLRATVWDSAAAGYAGANPETSGGTIGDITKMWIAFEIWTPGVPPSLINT